MNYSTMTKIEEIGKETLESFGGRTAEEICNGDCPVFVKRMVNKLEENGIEYTIMVTPTFSLMDELEGYEVEETPFASRDNISHCYVAIDGFGFDAYNPEGIEEKEMEYLSVQE